MLTTTKIANGFVQVDEVDKANNGLVVKLQDINITEYASVKVNMVKVNMVKVS